VYYNGYKRIRDAPHGSPVTQNRRPAYEACETTQRPKSYYVKRTIDEFLDEQMATT
jgi:hypothetical protein